MDDCGGFCGWRGGGGGKIKKGGMIYSGADGQGKWGRKKA